MLDTSYEKKSLQELSDPEGARGSTRETIKKKQEKCIPCA